MTLPRQASSPVTPRALAALGAALLLSGALAGCGGSEPTPTVTVGAPTASSSPTTQPEQPAATPTETTEPATCDSIIDPDTRDEMVAQGWTAKEEPFAAGGVTLSEGFQCNWADYEVPSGNLLLFGWAPLTADEATRMQSGLEAEGWKRETDAEGVYITEDPEQALTVDEDGYGMTYEFGDGWVIVSDTKQNLLLIGRREP